MALDPSSSSKVSSSKINGPRDRVIYIWSVPAIGHLNPTLCFVNELLNRLGELQVDRIVVYNAEAFRPMITNLPNNVTPKGDKGLIEFRDYQLKEHVGTDDFLKIIMNFDTTPGSLFRFFQCYENGLNVAVKHLFKRLLVDMDRDRPVLVLYDQSMIFPKVALKFYAKEFSRAAPLHGCYVTSFMFARGIFPRVNVLKKMGFFGRSNQLLDLCRNFSITTYDMLKYYVNFYRTLGWRLGFSFYDLLFKSESPLDQSFLVDDSLNLVFVMPELQPRTAQFSRHWPHVHFVGPCLDESARTVISARKIKHKYLLMLDEFLEKHRRQVTTATATATAATPSSEKPTEQPSTEAVTVHALDDETMDREKFERVYKPLIYISMGTVFNNENSGLFELLITVCKNYSHDKYMMIVSAGDEATYNKYANTSALCGQHVLMLPHAPQIDLLKRAHLFITHAGMNSVSEAINYGVPTICLPLSGDQPFVAYRLAEELHAGVRLLPDKTLTMEKINEALDHVLKNPMYRKRAQELSQASKSYSGHKTACEITVKFLSENEKKH